MDSGKLCRNAESEPVQEHIPTCSKQPATPLKHVSTVSDADHVSMLGLDGEIQRGRFFAVPAPRCQRAGRGCCPAACPAPAELQQLVHHHGQGLPLPAVVWGALKHGQVSAFLWGKLGGFTRLSERWGLEGEGKKQEDFYRLKTQATREPTQARASSTWRCCRAGPNFSAGLDTSFQKVTSPCQELP